MEEIVVGQTTVLRAHNTGHDYRASMKLTWECTMSWHGISFAWIGNSVPSRVAGVVGEAEWSLLIKGQRNTNRLRLELLYRDETKDEEDNNNNCCAIATWTAVISSLSPHVQLHTDSSRLNSTWTCPTEELRGLDEGFWTANVHTVEVTVLFPNRACVRGYVQAEKEKELFLAALRDNYVAGDLMDATLVTADEREIRVQRAVLAARSDAFRAMFTHDTKEKQTGRCEIEDIPYAALKVFADDMHGVDVTNQLSLEVFVAADKYQMDGLKWRCVEEMKQSVTIENAVDYFELSKHHELDDLTAATMDFVKCNYKAFVDADQMAKVATGKHGKEFFMLLQHLDMKRSASEADL